jgi:hypothetical protein
VQEAFDPSNDALTKLASSRLKLALKITVSFFGSVILVHVVAIALSVLFAIDLPIRALVGWDLVGGFIMGITLVCVTPFLLLWLFVVIDDRRRCPRRKFRAM